MEMPQCFSSASKAARPLAMFSSFFSFLNHWRILLRASLDLAIFIQSRLGPLAFLEVRISTMSPFFSTWSKRDDPAVDLGAHHPVAHGGVDGIGEVDGGGAGGQVLHVAAGGEDEHLVGEHIHLQGVDIVLGVGALLVLQQAADPLVPALGAGALAVLLVFPVGGHAVLRHLVHLLGADLHLEGQAVRAR